MPIGHRACIHCLEKFFNFFSFLQFSSQPKNSQSHIQVKESIDVLATLQLYLTERQCTHLLHFDGIKVLLERLRMNAFEQELVAVVLHEEVLKLMCDSESVVGGSADI